MLRSQPMLRSQLMLIAPWSALKTGLISSGRTDRTGRTDRSDRADRTDRTDRTDNTRRKLRLARTLMVLLSMLAMACSSGNQPPGAANNQEEQAPPASASGIAAMNLSRLDGSTFATQALNRDSATVLFVLSPECPLCLDYAYTFRTLADEYQTRGIRFVGVFPGEFFSELQIRKYCSRFRLDFPMVLDPEYALTRALGANTTPEALLLDQNGHMVYQGGIDNWAYEVGQKRLEPTEHYLRDALVAFEAGQKPSVARTRPVGCLIE